MTIELRWKHYGALMNFAMACELNGVRIMQGAPGAARLCAQRLAQALGYTETIPELNLWTEPRLDVVAAEQRAEGDISNAK